MPEPTRNDPTAKAREVVTNSAHFLLDVISDAVAKVRDEVRSDHEAVQDIADLLATPSVDDPLTVIHEIEDRLGVEHYDWPKYGQWIRQPTNDD